MKSNEQMSSMKLRVGIDRGRAAAMARIRVGSMCRRPMAGKNGLGAVMSALSGAAPSHVRFHLFGVKSQAIGKLAREFPERIASMDSQAWSVRARKVAHASGVPCDNELRARYMEEWYDKQQAHVGGEL